jgi:hypothetical protein
MREAFGRGFRGTSCGMSEKPRRLETPDESIPQDPGVPGPATKKEGDWPPESSAADVSGEETADRDTKARDSSVSEAVGRMPRHRADEERETER